MRRLFVFLSLLAANAVLLSPTLAQNSPVDFDVDVFTNTSTVAVRVSASPEELDRLANFAFEAHGRYRRVSSNPTFDIRFTAVAGNRVQVDVARGSTQI